LLLLLLLEQGCKEEQAQAMEESRQESRKEREEKEGRQARPGTSQLCHKRRRN
jgi:hypothetical protein